MTASTGLARTIADTPHQYSHGVSTGAGQASGRGAASTGLVPEAGNEGLFTIEVLQKIEGEASFTKGKLSAKLGQAIDYEVILANTGSANESFSALSDPGCLEISPSGSKEVAPGASVTYTCKHATTAAGPYIDEASIEIVGPGGTPVKAASNKVEVEVAAGTLTGPTGSTGPTGPLLTHGQEEIAGTKGTSPGGGGAIGATAKVGRASVDGETADVPLSCTGPSGYSCKMELSLSVIETLKGKTPIAIAARKKAKLTKRTLDLGLEEVSLDAGKSGTARISLNSMGESLLAQHHTLAVRLSVSGPSGTGAGYGALLVPLSTQVLHFKGPS